MQMKKHSPATEILKICTSKIKIPMNKNIGTVISLLIGCLKYSMFLLQVRTNILQIIKGINIIGGRNVQSKDWSYRNYWVFWLRVLQRLVKQKMSLNISQAKLINKNMNHKILQTGQAMILTDKELQFDFIIQ